MTFSTFRKALWRSRQRSCCLALVPGVAFFLQHAIVYYTAKFAFLKCRSDIFSSFYDVICLEIYIRAGHSSQVKL